MPNSISKKLAPSINGLILVEITLTLTYDTLIKIGGVTVKDNPINFENAKSIKTDDFIDDFIKYAFFWKYTMSTFNEAVTFAEETTKSIKEEIQILVDKYEETEEKIKNLPVDFTLPEEF